LTIYVWVGVAVGAAVLLLLGLKSARPNRVHYAQLGAMSEQWLAEQRANDRPY
jgi:hypothetical protein